VQLAWTLRNKAFLLDPQPLCHLHGCYVLVLEGGRRREMIFNFLYVVVVHKVTEIAG